MKTLNEALSNTLITVKQTQSNHADVVSSLTNKGGLTTIPPAELCKQSPEQNNKQLIAKLEQSLKLSITIEVQLKYTDHDADFVPKYIVPEKMTTQQKDETLNLLSAYMHPSPPDIVSQMLGKLVLRCANNNPFDTKAGLMCAVEDLSVFPTDIVKEVVFGYRGTFLPAINTLLTQCENLFYYHQKMKSDISRASLPD